MTFRDAVEYEIYSSWWASWCWWGWTQSLAAWWYSRKARRKLTRLLAHRQWLDELPSSLVSNSSCFQPNHDPDILPFSRN